MRTVDWSICLAALVVLRSVGNELLPTPDLWRAFPEDWYTNAYTIWPWLTVAAGRRIRDMDAYAIHGGAPRLRDRALTCPLLIAGGWFDACRFGVGMRWDWRSCSAALGAAVVPSSTRRRTRRRGPGAGCAALSRGRRRSGARAHAHRGARKLSGGQLAGPIGGFFSMMRTAVSLLIPLAVVSTTLAGHGSANGWRTISAEQGCSRTWRVSAGSC